VVNWLRVMHVNVNAPFILTRSLLPLLRLSKDASVLFVTCAASLRGRAYAGADAASKFALEGLMQVLSKRRTARRTSGSTASIRADADTVAKSRLPWRGPCGNPRAARRARPVPVPARACRPRITGRRVEAR